MNAIAENRQKKPYNIKSAIDQLEKSGYSYNNKVIGPELRVNSGEVAGQGVPVLTADINGKLLGERELRALNDHINKQPNKDLMIITAIECLMSQVNDRLDKLKPFTEEYNLQHSRIKARAQALEDIEIFQKTTLIKLKKAFE